MKNQYFGDAGDYGKYSLLKFLAEHDAKIAVNWYLTEKDDRSGNENLQIILRKRMNENTQNMIMTSLPPGKGGAVSEPAERISEDGVGRCK